MKKLFGLLFCFALGAIFLSGCINVSVSQDGNTTTTNISIAPPNVSIDDLNKTIQAIANATGGANVSNYSPEWGPWSSTPMPSGPAPSVVPAAAKYGAQVFVSSDTRLHRLPRIQRVNNVSDETYSKKSLMLMLTDDKGSPVEHAVIVMDGQYNLKEGTSGTYGLYSSASSSASAADEAFVFGVYQTNYADEALSAGLHYLELTVDGQPAGKFNFTIINPALQTPGYGSFVDGSGFDLTWSEGASSPGTQYGVDFWNVASDTSCIGYTTLTNSYGQLNQTKITLPARDFQGLSGGAIETGIYGIQIEAAQLRSVETNGQTAFAFMSTETASHDVMSGPVTDCCNPFVEKPCLD